jgi:hypothetical protein
MAEEQQYLYVKSALDDDRVALHEVDDAHPGGSAIVAGDLVAKVGDTAMVRSRLRDRWLVEVSGGEETKKADKWADERQEMMSASPTAAEPERVDFHKEAVERMAERQSRGEIDERDPLVSDVAVQQQMKEREKTAPRREESQPGEGPPRGSTGTRGDGGPRSDVSTKDREK